IYVAAFSSGPFVKQEHLGPIALYIHPDLRFVPTMRFEAACASSSAAVHAAVHAIESGRYKNILVIGAEKMTERTTPETTEILAYASYFETEGSKGMTFPALFAEYAKGYKAHYKISDDVLRKMFATVSALCYRNAMDNPLAQMGKGSVAEKLGITTAEAILALDDKSNPVIADPLRLHDCSLISDGSAAIVLSNKKVAKSAKKAVQIAGIGNATEIMEEKKRPQMYMLEAGKIAAKRAYEEAKIKPKDIDLAEVHDCFAINHILTTEALGLSEDGKAGYDYMEGRFTRDDKVAVNISGGLKAKGHPVGATGASMHALIFKQLVDEPIGATLTKKKPEVGVTFNVGGSAVSNFITVLKRVK
ncbi:MAG TPA: beta-ketoacyl synthase N-terminal-like domain-containing protein, partial [Spirochaetota bacterium]|nr:beta-ketoacyl synthase N-terminal-like domain-containing protein [Spirochaetota bacterium]